MAPLILAQVREIHTTGVARDNAKVKADARFSDQHRLTPVSYYERHVFFCCNQRQAGEICCND